MPRNTITRQDLVDLMLTIKTMMTEANGAYNARNNRNAGLPRYVATPESEAMVLSIPTGKGLSPVLQQHMQKLFDSVKALLTKMKAASPIYNNVSAVIEGVHDIQVRDPILYEHLNAVITSINQLKNKLAEPGDWWTYICQTGCQVSCQTSCETSCQVGCQVSCQTGCQVTSQACTSSCQVSCQTSCETSCQTGCQVTSQACTSSCQVSCQTSCETSCQVGCQVSCQTGCQTSCQQSCQLSCQVGCQINCQTTCMWNCQTSCQVSCQGCNASQCHNQRCGGWH